MPPTDGLNLALRIRARSSRAECSALALSVDHAKGLYQMAQPCRPAVLTP